jgi:hypothetical protein
MSSLVGGRRRPRLPFFRETFKNPARLADNGGVLSGVNNLSVDDGLVCDGTSSGASYPVIPQRLCTAEELTFYLRFTPSFDYDDAIARTYFAGGVAGTEYWMRKNAAAVVRLSIGGVLIASIDPSSAWVTGVENIWVASCKDGDTTVWLNGTKILDADATSWAPDPASMALEFEIGATTADTTPFLGTISEVRIYDYAVDANEAADLYAGNELGNIQPSDALVWLPLREQKGNGVGTPFTTPNHGSLGSAADAFVGADGLTATGGQPTKLSPKGFRFAAGTEQLRIPDQDALSFVSGGVDQPFSIVAFIKPDDPDDAGQNRIVSKQKTDNSEIEYLFYFSASDLRGRLYSTDANAGGRKDTNDEIDAMRMLHVVMSYNGDGDPASGDIKLYKDGVQVDTATNDAGAGFTTPMQVGDGDVIIGNAGAGTSDFTGDMLEFSIWGKELSPTEIKALFADARARLNV